jgi:cytochrome c-type biogenesis protein CcmH
LFELLRTELISMVVFWVLAALMSVLALAFVLVPLLRARGTAAGPTSAQVNLEVLRSQRREIEADVASGVLPREARAEALEELVGRAEQDLAQAPAAMESVARRPWPAAIAVAIAVPALAFGLYARLGNPGAAAEVVSAKASQGLSDRDVVAMVDKLAVKVRERPDDVQGWALLARSTAALGRFDESVRAYEHLARLVPPDAGLLADWADALGMAQGQSLAGRPRELIEQALKIDPANHKALALAGTAAMDAGDYAASARYWNALAAQMPEGSADATQINAILAEVREKAAAAGKPVGDLPKVAHAKVQPGKSVSGLVSITPQMAAKLDGSETLFVFARAEGGSRVPLAVVRGTAQQLPLEFALDDSQAMAPGMSISSAQALRVEARISKAGRATPQSGDLEGASAVVKPGAKDVNVVIDKVVP